MNIWEAAEEITREGHGEYHTIRRILLAAKYDNLNARAEAAEAEIERLRAAITDMANTYADRRGKSGGTGIADELRAILNSGDALAQ